MPKETQREDRVRRSSFVPDEDGEQNDSASNERGLPSGRYHARLTPQLADHARNHALDPTLSGSELKDARESMDDAAFNTNPIADGGKISRARRLVPKPAADLGPPLGVAGDAIQSPLLLHDAGKTQMVANEVRDLTLEERTPAIAFA